MMAALTGNRLQILVTTYVGVLLVGCGGPEGGPEEAVRAWVSHGHEAAEAKDRNALMDMISPAYADARGNNRDDIENMMRFYFLRQSKVALITRIDELNIIGDSAAELVLQVGMAGTDNTAALGFNADAYRFEMELQRDGDEWLLIAARWGGLRDAVH
jgi:hypothetical protein